MAIPRPSLVRFGAFEADLYSGELRKFGARLKLQDRPFQILAILLEQPGQTVTREQLQSRLWPADTFVDFEHGLNTAVNKLRQALSDDPDNPRFIETLPKRGYRFIAPVSKPNGDGCTAGENGAAPVGSSAAVAISARAASHDRLRRWPLFYPIGGIVVLALVAAGTWYGLRPKSVPAWSEMRIAPLNGLPYEMDAAFSPDGGQVAFVWSGGAKDKAAHIYVSQIVAESPRRLTNSPWPELAPVWSPDGKYIAFMRFAIDQSLDGVYIASAVGGSERKVYSLTPHQAADQLGWSPDGKNLAFGESVSVGEPRRIYLLSLDTLEKHPITSPPSGILGDSNPAFSPDGQNVAFERDRLDTQEIFVVAVQGGTPRQVTFDSRIIQGVSWNADGSALIYSSNRGGLPSLWRIPASGGTPEPLPFGRGGARAIRPVVAHKGNRMAYTYMTYNSAIWRSELPAAGSKPAPAATFIVSTELEEGPAYSPDGKHIAFQSTRTGNYEIWRCDADGTNLVQLTHFKGPLTGTPRWSPDSRELVFDSRPAGHSEIFVINAEGGQPRQVTSGSFENGVADWSTDGKWIYFSSSRGGTWEIWKMPAQGGTPVQVTHRGGFAPEPSRDGKFIYYAKGRDLPGVWRVPADGGEETKLLEGPPATGWGYFTVIERGVYYGDENRKNGASLYFYDFKTQRSAEILSLNPFGSSGAPGLSISPDGHYALYTALAPMTLNIMLVENFRD